MMAQADVSKRVLYTGVWQSQTVSDQLLQQIASQNAKKKKSALKGSPSILNLTKEKLDILIYDTKGKLIRNDQVPLTDVVDIAASKNTATCIYAIVQHGVPRNYYIFVFHCACDRDAGDIIQGFGKVKQRLSGEGYNTDIKPAGNNWTLQQKEMADQAKPENGHVTVVQSRTTQNGGVTVINTEKEEGETRIVTTTRTVQPPVPKQEVVVTDDAMRYELHHLADEVRDIKTMLNKSQGRQTFEKHYKYLLEQPTITTTTNKTATHMHQPERYVVVQQKSNEPERRFRSDTVRVVQRVPQNRHFSSRGSVTSSVHSGYTKRVYDSPNPTFERDRLYYQQHRPTVTSKRYIQKVQPRPRSQEIVFAYHGDVVTKNIEDVYKNRSSVRLRAVPSVTPSSEYFKVSPQSHSSTILVNPPEENVKQFIEEREILTKEQHQSLNPEIRHVYENTDFANEVTVEKVTSVRQPQVIVVDNTARANVVDTHYTNNVTTYSGDDNVVVIKADTDVYKSAIAREEYPNNVDRRTEIHSNKVYHIRSEGVASIGEPNGGIRYTVVENGQPPETPEDGLWESYAGQPDVDADKETIEKEHAYRYHEDEAGNGSNGDEKRVHYMDEIEQTINDLHNEEDDEDVRQELEEITNRKAGDEDILLNAEELAAFNTEQNVVIIDKID